MGQTMKIEVFLISQLSLEISEHSVWKPKIHEKIIWSVLENFIIVVKIQVWDIFDKFQGVWNPNFSNWIVHTLKSLVCL